MNEREKIKKGDVVMHQLSRLHFRCENAKHEKWMNENHYYEKVKDQKEAHRLKLWL